MDVSRTSVTRRNAFLKLVGLAAVLFLLPAGLLIVSVGSTPLSPVERQLLGEWQLTGGPHPDTLTFFADRTAIGSQGFPWSWYAEGGKLHVEEHRPFLVRLRTLDFSRDRDVLPITRITPSELQLGKLNFVRVQ